MTSVATPACSRSPLVMVERVIGGVAEVVAAILVVAETIILLMGVISRFVFNRPLIWTDELASILFLWLAMMGAVVALCRGGHMRLSTVVALVSPAWRERLETLAVGVALVFLMLLVKPALEYVEDQSFFETPALGWSGAIRAFSLAIGFGLMLVVSLLRLFQQSRRDVALIAGVLGLLAIALWFGGPVWAAIGHWSLAVFFVLIAGSAILLGVPIAFAFGIGTVAFLLSTTTVPLAVVAQRFDEGMSSIILLAVPLFVLLGQLTETTGMARVMVEFLASLIGHVRGGLSYVLLCAMLLVSGISGSKAADQAAVAPVLFPEMKRRNMDEGEMLSLLASSAAMSETIPPSLVLIAVASVTGMSVAALFTAGLLPGIVLALALAILARHRARDAAVARAPLSVVGKTFLIGLPALVLPVLIRAAVVEGIATPTEVATIGTAYCVVVGLVIYRGPDWRSVRPMLIETATLTGAILLVMGAATGMAWALTQSGFSRALTQIMGAVPGGQWGFLAVSILAFIVLGSVLEGIPAVVLFGPLLFPVARTMGVNEIHYAIVVILAMGIGLFSPPFGIGYYTASAIGKVHPNAGLICIWPYLGVLVLALLIVAAVPWISLGFL